MREIRSIDEEEVFTERESAAQSSRCDHRCSRKSVISSRVAAIGRTVGELREKEGVRTIAAGQNVTAAKSRELIISSASDGERVCRVWPWRVSALEPPIAFSKPLMVSLPMLAPTVCPRFKK